MQILTGHDSRLDLTAGLKMTEAALDDLMQISGRLTRQQPSTAGRLPPVTRLREALVTGVVAAGFIIPRLCRFHPLQPPRARRVIFGKRIWLRSSYRESAAIPETAKFYRWI